MTAPVGAKSQHQLNIHFRYMFCAISIGIIAPAAEASLQTAQHPRAHPTRGTADLAMVGHYSRKARKGYH
jgi:hypothetical protein